MHACWTGEPEPEDDVLEQRSTTIVQWLSAAKPALEIVHKMAYYYTGDVVPNTLSIPKHACLSTGRLPMQRKRKYYSNSKVKN
jgi:hypothetical protein